MIDQELLLIAAKRAYEARFAKDPRALKWHPWDELPPGVKALWCDVALAVLQAGTGKLVHKDTGDYSFQGDVRSIFTKRSGALRVVVENDAGLVHIFNTSQLKEGLRNG